MTIGQGLALLFDATCGLVCLFALVRGGMPERLGAVINGVAVAATWALRTVDQSHLAPADLSIVTVDLAVALAFYWLGVTTIRFWPIWAAGFALANLFMTGIGALLPNVPLFAYHTGLGVYAYLALGALALGTIRLPRDAASYLRNGSRRLWLAHLQETS